MNIKRLTLVVLSLLLAVLLLQAGLVNAEELPLGLKATVIELRPDLAKSITEEMAEQTKIIMGSMAKMFTMTFSVYQIEGDIQTVFQDQEWPPETQVIPVQKEEIARAIKRLLKDSDEFKAVWGAGWVNQAEKAAAKYSGVEMTTRTIVLPPNTETLTTYSITLTTPYVSMKTFELHEGLYLIISKMEIGL